jgi:hypothetical protein
MALDMHPKPYRWKRRVQGSAVLLEMHGAARSGAPVVANLWWMEGRGWRWRVLEGRTYMTFSIGDKRAASRFRGMRAAEKFMDSLPPHISSLMVGP